ncbi:MAG: class I SAM-dependent methyltransferase [Neisseriaceae bacterium]
MFEPDIKLRADLPELGKYTISEDFASILIDEILTNQPKVIVEAGSGVSTILSAYCIEKNCYGKVYSLEHIAQYVEETRNMITQHQLNANNINIIHSPLVTYEFGQEKFNWYSLEKFPNNLTIDLLIVDGPPRTTGKMARYPIIPLFSPYLSSKATIILDDAKRDDEKEIANRWLREYPSLNAKVYNTQKGAILFKFNE